MTKYKLSIAEENSDLFKRGFKVSHLKLFKKKFIKPKSPLQEVKYENKAK